MNRVVYFLASAGVVSTLLAGEMFAEQGLAEKTTVLKLADGKLQLPVSEIWKSEKPRSRIVQYEFSIPAADGDQQAGRLTIMAAGGSVEANIARWVSQFQDAEGKPLGEDAQHVEKKHVGNLVLHVVDISGDFQDKPRGPFGPSVNRPGYRMLAAIVPTKDQGTWFIKAYGPQKTMGEAKALFDSMIEGIVWKP